MSARTPNLDLYTIDRVNEGNTMASLWVDEISGETDSNMTRIDNGFGKLSSDIADIENDVQKLNSELSASQASQHEILGDGSKKEFTIIHNRKTKLPLIAVYDENLKIQLEPIIEIINKNSINLKFIYPLERGRALLVAIN